MNSFLSKLGPFKWTLHNLIAHPLGELIFLFSLGRLEALSNKIHDATVPVHTPGEGRG